jgi:hypothetical protein
MSFDPADNDLIEKYLLGKLTDPEISAFKDRLYEDREFARKFRLIKTFPEMMSEAGKAEMDRKLTEAVEKVLAGNPDRSRKKTYFILGIVTFIAVAGIILLVLSPWKDHPEPVVNSEKKVSPISTAAKTRVTSTKKDSVSTQQPETTVNKEDQEKRSVPDLKTSGTATPDGGAKLSRKETILFKWTQKFDTFTRFTIFSDADGRLMLWRGVTPGIQECSIPGSYLIAGKFYWCVGSTEKRHSFVVVE